MDVPSRSIGQGDGRFYGRDFFERQPASQIADIGKTECSRRLMGIAGHAAIAALYR
jgi:hypothetical protein